MPAPSSMFSRPNLPITTSDSNRDAFHGNNSGAVENPTRDENESLESASNSQTAAYDEIFVSKPVRELKTMLWEIKDFQRVHTNRVERAMSIEFEMGRLGSMERHLPRRSRWKILLDVEDIGGIRTPAVRVLQLSPESKTIFYQLGVSILEKSSETEPRPDKESEFQTQNYGYKEGVNDSESYENIFPILINTSCGNTNPMEQIQNYLYDGSLFLKLNIEILEDASI